MAKRFTDTSKWDRLWFRKLKPIHKILWNFLCDKCDHSGIIDVDIESWEFFIGTKLDLVTIENEFQKQFLKIDECRWFLIDFIPFQYNCQISELNPSNKVHASIIDKLNKFNIQELLKEGANKPLSRGLEGDKDKDMDKDKAFDKRKEAFANQVIPFKNDFAQKLIDDFIAYWTEISVKGKKMRFESEKFFDIKKRLDTFKRNEETWNSTKSKKVKDELSGESISGRFGESTTGKYDSVN